MSRHTAAHQRVRIRPLKVLPEVPAFRAIGIPAVAAAATLNRRPAPRHQDVVDIASRELPPLLHKDKFVD